jgi:pyruvate,water dikinase
MQELPEFERHYHNYLARFGDRCLDELKLESATLHDDPLMLLRSVGYYAQRLQQLEPVDEPNQATAICRQAEAQVGNMLAGNVMRSVVFAWVLKQARARVRDRENLRFERTRLFGRVRRIFIELGRRFSALELLADPRDIFYLEVGEVFGFIEGRSTTTNLKGLVALRKADFEQYRAMPAPDNRFLTYGIVNQGNRFVSSLAPSSVVDSAQIQGLGCCPGRVQGPARIIMNPRDAQLNPGDILVAERTDPGWIMLFTCAAGVLVERGSQLSHSAIVAREMNIPTIVGLAGITQWVKDGDWLELDGSSGTVRRIAAQKEAAA